ncbi:MBL fold metallo-hydrolase [Aerococcaceae bacterium WGS1372]
MPATTINIKYFAAGRCFHDIGQLFNGLPKEIRSFPASCWLIEHPRLGRILYDTGYNYDIIKNRVKYWIYRQFTPVQMSPDEAISKQLIASGIHPASIQWVILSHLHPDHIGDARSFTQAKFIVTPKVYATLKYPKLKNLVFREFLPKDILDRCVIVDDLDTVSTFSYSQATPLLGQDDILAVSCDGHAPGQLCLFFPEENLFIGSDITWGGDLIQYTESLNRAPKLILDDYSAYMQSIQLVRKLQRQGIEVLFSHDNEQYLKARFNKGDGEDR